LKAFTTFERFTCSGESGFRPEQISGVNFANVLCAAFTLIDPENVRTQSSHHYYFTLLGSARLKAAQKMLMKLTPDLGPMIL